MSLAGSGFSLAGLVHHPRLIAEHICQAFTDKCENGRESNIAFWNALRVLSPHPPPPNRVLGDLHWFRQHEGQRSQERSQESLKEGTKEACATPSPLPKQEDLRDDSESDSEIGLDWVPPPPQYNVQDLGPAHTGAASDVSGRAGDAHGQDILHLQEVVASGDGFLRGPDALTGLVPQELQEVARVPAVQKTAADFPYGGRKCAQLLAADRARLVASGDVIPDAPAIPSHEVWHAEVKMWPPQQYIKEHGVCDLHGLYCL